MKSTEHLQPTTETYDEWQLAYAHFNEVLFKNELPLCLITLRSEKKTMGYFSHERFTNRNGVKTDEIALNPAYFAVHGVHEALQTLAHEMCHLWQAHFGDPGRGRYHNKEWGKKMQSIGLMPSATGEPGGRKTGDHMNDYIIDGGVFIDAVESLKKKGFVLQWMDRFVSKTPMIHDYQAANQTDIEAESELTSIIENCDLVVPEVLPTEQSADSSLPPKKLPGRVKYTCQCDINIWAKPNIEVTCKQCNGDFEMVGF